MTVSLQDSPGYDVTADPSSPYYQQPWSGADRVPSGDEIRAEVTREIDEKIAKGWLGKVADPQRRDAEIQKRYLQRVDEARHGLGKGLRLRRTGTPPGTDWADASHEQMQQAITQNADPATVAEASEEWIRVGNELLQHQEVLANALNASEADWQGAGGEAVRDHLARVGEWLGMTAQGATLTGRQQEIHSQVLNETQKQMAANPPVRFDARAANARLRQITDPVLYARQAQQVLQTARAQQAAREHAARIMTQFDHEVGSAIATPEFPAPPSLPRSLPGGGGATAGGPVARSATAVPAVRADPGTPVTATVPGTPGVAAGAGAAAVPAVPSAPSRGTDTGTGTGSDGAAPGVGGRRSYRIPKAESDAAKTTVTPLSSADCPMWTVDAGYGGSGTATGPGSHSSPPSSSHLTSPSSVTLPAGGVTDGSTAIPSIGYHGGINGDSIATRLGGGSPPTPFPAGDIPPPGGTAVGGAGGGGATGAAGIGRIGRLGALESSASGSAGGRLTADAASGAMASGEAAAGRSVAAAAGMPGVGIGHGGRGKGEEDTEHRVADYIEGDPALFQGEKVVAPPVIGLWKKNEKKNEKK